MRRILFFLAFAIVGFAANAQSTVYVVFTSADNQSALNGAWHSKIAPDSQLGREITAHVISLICESSNKCFTFVSEDNVAPIKMPKDFLKTVACIDWDVLAPTLSKSQAEVKYKEIVAHDTIYFIDRNDIKGDEMNLIRVHEPRSRF